MQAINTTAVAAGGGKCCEHNIRAHMLVTEQIETETDALLQVIFSAFLAKPPIEQARKRPTGELTISRKLSSITRYITTNALWVMLHTRPLWSCHMANMLQTLHGSIAKVK